MSLAIRLRRPGKPAKGRYHYKIVVSEKRSKLEGRFVEELGFYDPSRKPKLFSLNLDKYDGWIKKGAKPSDTVRDLARKLRKSLSKDK